MLKEFKDFISKGNIMDLAVGVVIGGAFQSIVNSLVSDIIMPVVSVITGKVDFTDMVFTCGEASIKYGNFITAVVNFLIVALSIFFVITYLGKLQQRMEKMKLGEQLISKVDKNGKLKAKEEKPVEPTVKICPHCLSEIPYKATKCAHCTSDLEETVVNK